MNECRDSAPTDLHNETGAIPRGPYDGSLLLTVVSEHSQPSRRGATVRHVPLHLPVCLFRALRVDDVARHGGVRDILILRYLLPLLECILPHIQRALETRTCGHNEAHENPH